MPSTKLKSLPVDYRSLSLTAEEGFVLSRIGSQCSLQELAVLTGLNSARVEEIVAHLCEEGAIAFDEAPAFEATKSSPESPFGTREAQGTRRQAVASDVVPRIIADPFGTDWAEEDSGASPDLGLSSAENGGTSFDDEAQSPKREASLRLSYQQRFARVSTDERVRSAEHASLDDLEALCLDPQPQVISALLTNAKFGLQHARLVARYHANARGLERLGRRAEFLRDLQVQHRLLRNPQLPEGLLRRVLQAKRLLELYQTAVNRDLPERGRTMVRHELRTRFQTASSEEKAELVYRSEGRVLALLTGCTFDGRMTALLCGKTYRSVLLVQNLARFSATPPALLARLLRQPITQRSAHLKRALLQHPNLPRQAKTQR